MDVERGTFASNDPAKIARALERDAEASHRRKSSPYRSAMSMLTFYINRAGKNLSAKHRRVLEAAKDVLREQFGPQATPAAKAKPAKKTPRKTATRPKAQSTSRKKTVGKQKTRRGG